MFREESSAGGIPPYNTTTVCPESKRIYQEYQRTRPDLRGRFIRNMIRAGTEVGIVNDIGTIVSWETASAAELELN